VVSDLEKLVEPVTRGDPESPLRWTLARQGHAISYPVVAQLLDELGYSRRANRKTKKGAPIPTAMLTSNTSIGKCKRFLADKQPVLSVDTKKKELVGDLKE
jgi:hypothetical protein